MRLAVTLGSVCRHDNGLADVDWDGDEDGGDLDTFGYGSLLAIQTRPSTDNAHGDVDTDTRRCTRRHSSEEVH